MRSLLTPRIGSLGLIVLLHAALFWALGNRVPRPALPLATIPHEVSARLIVPAPAAQATAAHSPPAVERPVRHRRPTPSPRPRRKPTPVARHAPAPLQPAPAPAPAAPPAARPASPQPAPARLPATPQAQAAPRAPTAPEAPTPPKTISGVEYLQPPRPVYPRLSRRLGEQGKAVLRVLIDIRGHAQAIELKQSSGSERLDEAARDAVRHALFKPYLEDGKPVAVFALIPITFQLDF